MGVRKRRNPEMIDEVVKEENKMIHQWDFIYEDLLFHYPGVEKEIDGWYQEGQLQLTVTMKNGQRYIYNLIDHLLYNENYVKETKYDDESRYREALSLALMHYMRVKGTNQKAVAEKAGVCQMSMSKYMNGKVCPSSYNLYKICRAIGISEVELEHRMHTYLR